MLTLDKLLEYEEPAGQGKIFLKDKFSFVIKNEKEINDILVNF